MRVARPAGPSFHPSAITEFVILRYRDPKCRDELSGGEFWTPNWVTQQTVIFADGRTRVRNVHCLGVKNGVRVGEVWIGDRMACVTEVKFGVWREEQPKN
jgi:hypothetical protein